jgi:hypothetical protein
MNEDIENQVSEPEVFEAPDQDDRYPGTFFRIPGVPTPGKTTWSIA